MAGLDVYLHNLRQETNLLMFSFHSQLAEPATMLLWSGDFREAVYIIKMIVQLAIWLTK